MYLSLIPETRTIQPKIPEIWNIKWNGNSQLQIFEHVSKSREDILFSRNFHFISTVLEVLEFSAEWTVPLAVYFLFFNDFVYSIHYITITEYLHNKKYNLQHNIK